jgi:hypothetical protein
VYVGGRFHCFSYLMLKFAQNICPTLYYEVHH